MELGGQKFCAAEIFLDYVGKRDCLGSNRSYTPQVKATLETMTLNYGTMTRCCVILGILPFKNFDEVPYYKQLLPVVFGSA